MRRSSRIAELKKKQLDRSLNHVGFINANKDSEEDNNPMKETCTFKETISSAYKKEFVDAMIKEIENQNKRNH